MMCRLEKNRMGHRNPNMRAHSQPAGNNTNSMVWFPINRTSTFTLFDRSNRNMRAITVICAPR